MKQGQNWLMHLHTATSDPMVVTVGDKLRLLYADSDDKRHESARQKMVAATAGVVTPTDSFFIAKEKEVWEALKGKDKAAATRLLADDFVGMYDFGFFNKSEWVKQIDDQYTVNDYTISAPRVLRPSSTTALLLYTSTCKGTGAWADYCSHTSRISDLWVERNGEWLDLFSQDTTAATNPQAAKEKEVQNQSNTATVLQVENDLQNSYLHRDLTVHDRCLVDEFVGVDGEGNVYTKQQDMQELKDGTFTLKSFKLEDVQVRVLGEGAIVTGRNTTTAVYKGKQDTSTTRFVDTFLKRDGQWRMVYSQDTNLAETTTTSAESDDAVVKEIIVNEQKIFETLKRNDIAAFGEMLPEDVIMVEDDGNHTKAAWLKEFEAQKKTGLLFTDFKMEDLRLVRYSPSAATLVFKETIDGSQDGKPFEWHTNSSSGYVKRGGKWVPVLYQDTMAK